MTELRPAIEVANDLLTRLTFARRPADILPIITADRRALVDAIVAMLREESDKGAELGIAAEKGTTKRAAYGGGSLALHRCADLIAQRFGVSHVE